MTLPGKDARACLSMTDVWWFPRSIWKIFGSVPQSSQHFTSSSSKSSYSFMVCTSRLKRFRSTGQFRWKLFFIAFLQLGMKTWVRNSKLFFTIKQSVPREQVWVFWSLVWDLLSDKVLLVRWVRNPFQIKTVTLKQKVIVLQIQPFPVPSMLFGNTQTSSWFLFS